MRHALRRERRPRAVTTSVGQRERDTACSRTVEGRIESGWLGTSRAGYPGAASGRVWNSKPDDQLAVPPRMSLSYGRC